jgi:hypothetical protein
MHHNDKVYRETLQDDFDLRICYIIIFEPSMSRSWNCVTNQYYVVFSVSAQDYRHRIRFFVQIVATPR